MNTDCPRFVGLLLESLDGDLSAAERQALDAHLARCASCVAALQEHVILRASVAELARPSPTEPPPLKPELAKRCITAIQAARGRSDGGESLGGARSA